MPQELMESNYNLKVDSVGGDHVHCRLFMNGGKCGDLCFRVGEYQLFAAALVLGSSKTRGHLKNTSDTSAFDDAMREREEDSS